MSAEDQTRLAVKMMHMMFKDITFSPRGASVLTYMVANDVDPEDVENKLKEVLDYMIKTEPEEGEG
ncbi:hypothetical protein ES703_60604 [subsurface metagenome]